MSRICHQTEPINDIDEVWWSYSCDCCISPQSNHYIFTNRLGNGNYLCDRCKTMIEYCTNMKKRVN